MALVDEFSNKHKIHDKLVLRVAEWSMSDCSVGHLALLR